MLSPSRACSIGPFNIADSGFGKFEIRDNEDGEAITLDNFDETDAMADPILNSPRSIEACRMLGLEFSELIFHPLEYFLSSSKGFCRTLEDREFAAKRAARYEKNRQIQLRNVRAQRHELIEAQLQKLQGLMSLKTRTFCRSPVGAARLGFGITPKCCSTEAQALTVIEREKRELERIQQRQALEVQQMLNFEYKLTELQQERERKEIEQKRREELLVMERIQRQREVDELKRRREIERAEQHRQELQVAKQQALEQRRDLRRREQRAKQEEARRLRDAQLSERERQRHHEEARKQNEMQLKARELAEKQARNSARIANVLHEKDLQRSAQLEEAARKQQLIDERRQALEYERRMKEEEGRLQGLRKKEAIEGVQRQLAMIEEKRREQLQEKERLAQLRLVQREYEKEQHLKAQQREERRLERERRSAYERMEAHLHEKQAAVLRKTKMKAMAAQRMQEYKHASVRARLQDAKLREEEIQSALQRKNRQDEYRAKLLLSRIETDNHRIEHLQEQRASLIRRRQEIKQRAGRQKHEILESFYKMKVTKKLNLPKHIRLKIGIGRPRSASEALYPTQSLQTESKGVERPSGNSRRPMSAVARRSRCATISRQRITSRERQNTSDTDSCCGSHSAESAEEFVNFADEKIIAMINDLQRRQNEELLEVLQEEHHAEEQREHLLHQASADPRERGRIERLFDIERGLASERIMQITHRHECTLAAMMHELQAI
ncbi:uncharacterized protein PHALS_03759 [Plasmopara halstedii]|uniref:Uncharacterized protein n=1 Tax=Plasmopara halstedii TaxID=4781 RepID=A0A0P1B1G5_PLAHL|nr:uncharacterized protein PHALS_03759 [Plasmopara halstedii]CEG47105.1 hypothetical protein PHALS_03759 [Plasmopara halstedii]|eukprot:XP_024583474.1 hypothetical protein PHALS_03759 [Plasmopara halstedii]